MDIEDLTSKSPPVPFICPSTNRVCRGKCGGGKSNKSGDRLQYIPTEDGEWFKPETLDDLLALLEAVEEGKTYKIVMGNTSEGKGGKIDCMAKPSGPRTERVIVVLVVCVWGGSSLIAVFLLYSILAS